MREWLRLFEETQIYSPEEEDPAERAESERFERQRQIEKRIQQMCEQELGWSFSASYAIIYDADENEISIRPDEEEITLEQLQKLSALGSDITVSSSDGNYSMRVTIKTTPGLSIS